MTSAGFDNQAWIGRLAQVLPPLAQVQESYLREFQERHACVIDLRDGRPPPFPLEDLCLLYDEARNGRFWGLEEHYAPLRAVLDPVRHALLCHPTLERVAVTGRLIGDNDFWMQIPGFGRQVSAGTLTAGLMARAAELPEDGFRTALGELNALLSPTGEGAEPGALGGLDEGRDMLLFFGLCLSGRIEVADGMMLLPYEEVLRFVDRDTFEELAPFGAGIHGWRAVGAVARPFRWRPEFRRRGNVNEPMGPPPPPFFQAAAEFLDLLAVSHATRIAPIAELSNRIDGSAARLLGLDKQSLGFHQKWSAEGFFPREGCPKIGEAALAEAQRAFRDRESARYIWMAPIVSRLSEALSRNGRFALADRIIDVAISLERMFLLDEANFGRKLRGRTAELLGTDAASDTRIRENVKELYDVRSDIIHNRLHRLTPERVNSAYVEGFDLARQSLFKLLCDGSPYGWKGPTLPGD